MSDRSWKAFERQVAKFFGTKRTPGSGSAGTFTPNGDPITTTSDTLHKVLYNEAKRDKNYLGRQLLRLLDKTAEAAKREGKIPVVELKEHGRRGFFLVIHSDHLWRVAQERELVVLRESCRKHEKPS